MSEPTSFSLWFSGGPAPELLKTSFRHRLFDGESRSVRGKTAGAARARGTFQWTSAVQALCVLVLRSSAQYQLDGETAGLEGEAGSLAASLDAALSKPPQWLIEMFGVQSTGEPVIRRCVLRTNPDRQRPGPTAVALNTAFLPPAALEVFIDDRRVTDPLEQLALAGSIAVDNKSELQAQNPDRAAFLPAPFNDPRVIAELRSAFRDEIITTLRHCDVFTAKGLKSTLERIFSNPTFASLVSRHTALQHALDQSLSRSERYGARREILARHLPADRPLSVFTMAGQASSIALFTFLKGVRGYGFELNYRFHHAIEIMRMIIEERFAEPPDLCVMGIAPAASLISCGRKTGYVPLMLLGAGSHHLVAPKGASAEPGSEFFFLRDDPSTSQFYFESLIKAKALDAHAVTSTHLEIDELAEALGPQAAPNARGIIFFPYYDIHRRFSGLEAEARRDDGLQLKEFTLFIHERLLAQPKLVQAIDVAIRDAWLTLREGGPALEHVLDVMLQDAEHFTCLKRFAGLIT